MLQYALLHLFGYALTIEDLKKFRVSSATHILLLVGLSVPNWLS